MLKSLVLQKHCALVVHSLFTARLPENKRYPSTRHRRATVASGASCFAQPVLVYQSQIRAVDSIV